MKKALKVKTDADGNVIARKPRTPREHRATRKELVEYVQSQEQRTWGGNAMTDVEKARWGVYYGMLKTMGASPLPDQTKANAEAELPTA